MKFMRYTVQNLPALGQLPQAPPAPTPILPSRVVSVGIVALGIGLSMLGYNHRKTDLGVIGMGTGSSIAGAGIVLLILDLAGFRSSGQV